MELNKLVRSHSFWLGTALAAVGIVLFWAITGQGLFREDFIADSALFAVLRMLVGASLAVVGWFLLLSWLDKRAGFIFTNGGVRAILEANPAALAHYLGMRAVAVALIFAAALLAA